MLVRVFSCRVAVGLESDALSPYRDWLSSQRGAGGVCRLGSVERLYRPVGTGCLVAGCLHDPGFCSHLSVGYGRGRFP